MPAPQTRTQATTRLQIAQVVLITGTLKSLDGRKAYVSLSLSARGVECAHGEMLAIELKN
jgi:hypothetical protein